MHWEKLRQNVNWQMRLVPAVAHLNSDGDLLERDEREDWRISAATESYLEIQGAGGFCYRLAKDHIRNFTTDPQRSFANTNFGILTLLVQLFTKGAEMWAVPIAQGTVTTTSPRPNRATRARAHFAPELARLLRRQIYILDRAFVNFSRTALGRPPISNDTWISLTSHSPVIYPRTPELQYLPTADARLLAEFYGAVQEVIEIVRDWITTGQSQEYNAWNFLMHKVEHSVRLGELAVALICPNRQYDETMPASGTLVFQSQRILSLCERGRTQAIARFQAAQAAQAASVQKPMRRLRR